MLKLGKNRGISINWFFVLLVLIILFLVLLIYPKMEKEKINILEDREEQDDEEGEKKKKKTFVDRFITPLFIPTSPKHSIDVTHHDRKPFIGDGTFKSKGERICCEFMTQKFGKDFTTYRPDFLRNPATGKNLELDCFNPDLHIQYRDRSGDRKIVRLAVEYNGIQHYVFPNYFNENDEKKFHDQQDRDKYKMNTCEMEDVYLIVVPYSVTHSMIPTYIEGKLPIDYTIL